MMFERCTNETQRDLVLRIFRTKNRKRSSLRLAEFRANRTVSLEQGLEEVDQRISYSSKIYERNLLISPGPEGRTVQFGDLPSVEQTENNKPLDHPEGLVVENQTGSGFTPVTTSEYPLEPPRGSIIETASTSKRSLDHPGSSAESGIDQLEQTKVEMLPKTSLKIGQSLDKEGLIDLDFLKTLDMDMIKKRTKKIKEEGDNEKAATLTQDRWVVMDLIKGAEVKAKQESVLESVNRIIDVFLLEVKEEKSVAPDDIAREEASEEPVSEQAIEQELPPAAAGDESSDDVDFDIFYDCLEEQPYDPIADGFFD